MSKSLTFGILTIQNRGWRTLCDQWQTIEALGFDSVWLADHFVNPHAPRTSWLEAWTLLAALAANTSHIRVGSLVTPFPLRHPAKS